MQATPEEEVQRLPANGWLRYLQCGVQTGKYHPDGLLRSRSPQIHRR